MASYPIFVGPGGSDPARHIFNLAQAVQPTVGDALYAGQIIRTRILQRTASGVDSEGAPFVPYSDKYVKQKIGALGHADTVDLFGPQAHVHMLNTLLVKASGGELQPGQPASADPFSESSPASLFEIGFYGPEAIRATVHNEGATIRTRKGTGRTIKNTPSAQRRSELSKEVATMPRRHFFDANREDLQLVEAAIGERMMMRVQATK